MLSTFGAVAVVLASVSMALGQGPYGDGSYSSPRIGRCLLYSFTDGWASVWSSMKIMLTYPIHSFRHDSIPTAVQSLQARAPYWNVTFDHTEDLNWFNDTGLTLYDAVVFLHTTGESKSLFATANQRVANHAFLAYSLGCKRKSLVPKLSQQ